MGTTLTKDNRGSRSSPAALAFLVWFDLMFYQSKQGILFYIMGSVQIVLYGRLSTDCGYLLLKERVSYDREGHFPGYHFRLQYLNNFILLLIFDIKFGILLLLFS